MTDPGQISRFVRSALMDARPVEFQLVDCPGGMDAVFIAWNLVTQLRAMYQSMGGQDVAASTYRRGGTLVVVVKPRDDPPEE